MLACSYVSDRNGVGTADCGGGTEPTTEVSEDELFDVLSNQRRRFAVHLLKREADDSIAIGDMAEQIAAWENGIETAEITGTERKRVYTALQQSHLPKMDKAGVVDFNKNRGIVEPMPAMTDVDVYMDVVEGRRSRGATTTSALGRRRRARRRGVARRVAVRPVARVRVDGRDRRRVRVLRDHAQVLHRGDEGRRTR